MMEIKLQLFSFFVSFVYGFLIFISFNNIKMFLYSNNNVINLFNSILYFSLVFVIYFIILYKINGGNIHIYFLITVLFSFLLFRYLKKTLRK